MASFKKFFLVAPEEYSRLVNQSKSKGELLTHPNVKALKEIDNKIDSILQETTASDVEKLDEYNSELDSYKRNFRKAIEVPRKDALFGDPIPRNLNSNTPSTPSTPSPIADPVQREDKPRKGFFQGSLNAIPSSYQLTAAKLARFMESSKDFTISASGRLKYKGKELNESDATDLFKRAVTFKQTFGKQKEDVKKFLSALEESGFPTKSLPYSRMLKARDMRTTVAKAQTKSKWEGQASKKLQKSPSIQPKRKKLEWEKFDN